MVHLVHVFIRFQRSRAKLLLGHGYSAMTTGHSATELLAMPPKEKNSECPILVVPNFSQSFWCKIGCSEFFQTILVQKDCKKFGTAKIGHSKFFQPFWCKKDREKFGKVYGLDWTDYISTVVAETAVAIAIAQCECCPISLNIAAIAITQWEWTLSIHLPLAQCAVNRGQVSCQLGPSCLGQVADWPSSAC